VFRHYTVAFLPFLIGFKPTIRHTAFDRVIATTPLQLPLSGNLAVCLFFVLSGFVLSLSFFVNKDHHFLMAGAARRYFRLMLPVLISVLLVFVVLTANGVHSQDAARVTESSNWLATYWNYKANFWQAIYQGSFGSVFRAINYYNPVLWTIHVELYGSFLLFSFLALFGTAKNRWIIYTLLLLITLKTYYPCFIAGIVLCDLWVNRPSYLQNLKQSLVWPLLVIGCLLGAWSTTSIYHSVYADIHVPGFNSSHIELLAHIIGTVCIVIAVLRLAPLQRVLTWRLFAYLGRISFSLYLTHFIILGSFASWLFVVLSHHLNYGLSFIGMFIPALGLTLLVATLFERYIDVPAIRIAKLLGAAFTNGPLPWDSRHYRAARRKLNLNSPDSSNVDAP
jgi:peptidoglycan/LPS O-acetylase OafA/YrhL